MPDMLQSNIHLTPSNVPYLTEPHIILLAQTTSNLDEASTYIEPQFPDVEGSWMADWNATQPDELIMFAGQLCYQSFGPARTQHAQSPSYIARIIEQRHFSVLEHTSVSYLFYGISRSLTHELVRHRHLSYSQVSQRYVNNPRFVERPEYRQDPYLHQSFEDRIEQINASYEMQIIYLTKHPAYSTITPATEKRKAVQQVARSMLPNETEAPIVVTGNLRAWRHFITMRGSTYAEPEIRRLAHATFDSLSNLYPSCFADYDPTTLTTPYTEQ